MRPPSFRIRDHAADVIVADDFRKSDARVCEGKAGFRIAGTKRAEAFKKVDEFRRPPRLGSARRRNQARARSPHFRAPLRCAHRGRHKGASSPSASTVKPAAIAWPPPVRTSPAWAGRQHRASQIDTGHRAARADRHPIVEGGDEGRPVVAFLEPARDDASNAWCQPSPQAKTIAPVSPAPSISAIASSRTAASIRLRSPFKASRWAAKFVCFQGVLRRKQPGAEGRFADPTARVHPGGQGGSPSDRR